MRLIKDTYIYKRTKQTIKQLEKLINMKCNDDLTKDRTEIVFLNKNMGYVIDLENKKSYAIIRSDIKVTFNDINKIANEEVKMLSKDIVHYYNWVNNPYNNR